MKITRTKLAGVLLIQPQIFKDERGVFFESWRQKNYKDAGICEEFLQDNVSYSRKNVLKGLHYQKNQGQLVGILDGKVFDVVVDLRPKSSTFKQYFSVELTSDVPYQIYMPPGCAHGFCVLSDFAVMNYKCTEYYSPQDEKTIYWRDPEFNINWPKANHIISEKDATALCFSALEMEYD